jgi:hypothetical protein
MELPFWRKAWLAPETKLPEQVNTPLVPLTEQPVLPEPPAKFKPPEAPVAAVPILTVAAVVAKRLPVV